MMEKTSSSKRIYWIDAAKALGIFLVFYGHIVEAIFRVESQPAFQHFKFLYSFHMPFFFFISGFFFKRRYENLEDEIKDLFLKRILPVLIFGVLAIPMWLIYQGIIFGDIHFKQLIKYALHYLRGDPDLNTITWFLVCLFTAETFAAVLLPKRSRPGWLFLVSAAAMAAGLFMTSQFKLVGPFIGLDKNTWYFHEGFVALGFYGLGYLSFNAVRKFTETGIILRALVLAVGITVTILTYNLNQPYDDFVVVLKESLHGNAFLFLITALSGTAALLALSTFLPRMKIISYVGQNTLILIATNGYFLQFVYPHLAEILPMLDNRVLVTLYGLTFSILSILLSVPLIFFLNRYFPQLVGYPKQDGPLLPAITTLNGFKRL